MKIFTRLIHLNCVSQPRDKLQVQNIKEAQVKDHVNGEP